MSDDDKISWLCTTCQPATTLRSWKRWQLKQLDPTERNKLKKALRCETHGEKFAFQEFVQVVRA